MKDLAVHIIEEKTCTLVQIEGTLQFDSGEAFDAHVETIQSTTQPVVVVDMSRVTFISSAGLGALIRMNRAMKDQQRKVRLAAVAEPVYQMLCGAKLDEMFPVFPTVENALIHEEEMPSA